MSSVVGKDIPLGRDTSYVDTYTPSLLRSIEREHARRVSGIAAPLPFHGEDLWTCYELSWLNAKGKPEVAVLELRVPCTSLCIVESKSLKLYLNSFAQTHFTSRAEVHAALDSDLGLAFRAPVIVTLLDVQHPVGGLSQFPGRCIDHLDIEMDQYVLSRELLDVEHGDVIAKETLYTNVFRSVCPVTGQPDWASVMVRYVGRRIVHETLLRYLVSYRTHAAFHEDTIERIFVDVRERCAPDHLAVYGRFMRRGGIDINPFRSTDREGAPSIRLPRQ
jgi:7-cyano-7-deazaguanine reductase